MPPIISLEASTFLNMEKQVFIDPSERYGTGQTFHAS